MRRWVLSGGILAAMSVMLGAFGAHALKKILSASQLATYQTAVQYQFYHSIALILVGIVSYSLGERDKTRIDRAGYFFLLGIVLFSGSLYSLVFGGPKFLGPITPLGGLSFMLGWLTLAFSVPMESNKQ